MPTVQELYERHMANFGDECISIFGYPGYQVLEAVQFWERNKVREMTRAERIRDKLIENRSDNTSTALEQSEGYCAAYVDDEMAVEKKVKQMQEMMTNLVVKQKDLDLLYPNKLQRDAFIRVFGIRVELEPDLSPVQKAICSIMTEVEVRMGPDYGKLSPGYPSAYGAGCLIDGLKNKGYRIVTNDSRAKFKHAMLKQGYSENCIGLHEALAAYDSTLS